MAKQVLYRKYRSRNLGELVGQEHISTTLQAAFKKGAIAHAYLLTGPRGVGKTTVARIMAHQVNKLDYQDDQQHLDIIEIDAASNRRIDEIRELRETINLVPSSLKYKVYIIDEVHMLTREAFNALLKTLEEPPAHALFILATTEFHKVPATIVSRCQRFAFKHIAKPLIVDHLKQIAKTEKINIDLPSLKIIAAHSQGSFRDALSLLDQLGSLGIKITETVSRSLIGLAAEVKIDQLLAAYRSQDLSKMIEAYRQLINDGANPVIISQQLAEVLRDNLQKSTSAQADLGLLEDLLELASARNPEALLEVVLLKHQLAQQPTANQAPISSPSPATKPQVAPKPQPQPKPEPKPQPEPEPKPEPESKPAPQAKAKLDSQPATKASKKTKSGQASPLTEAGWVKVLEVIRAEKKTLYGVLRIAKLDISPQVLSLTFDMPFHYRIFESQTNRNLLEKVLNDLNFDYGQLEIVQGKYVPQQIEEDQPIEAASPDSPPATEVDQAINIFGGGQIVGNNGP